ncbi:MAG: adenylate/guanylate cyclase domain-containing protein [Deltaproteobacteria bacterium]|nr:adenylate/guanylate cyclase domain-containing protein [Deltaproteobacteria bacterium]
MSMITWWENLVPRNAVALLKNSGRRELPAKEIREVAVFFVDIEGCTRLCEDLPPREVNEVRETYFSEYLDIIRADGGEVTEVLGDGLLALFEGPDIKENVHAALTAARRIQVRTVGLNRRRRGRHDPIIVNIGLNAGPALTGLTRLRGRSGERWVYSASGPVTNVAARLAALAHGGQALTTKATVDLLGCKCRSIGPHVLKNVTGVIDVVEILPIEDKKQEASGAGTKSGDFRGSDS